MVVSSVPCDHETEDTMPVIRKRRGAGAPAHTARVDDEPLHREVEKAGVGVTTTRKPMPRAYTARAIERPGKWDTIAKTHFQSDLSNLVGWYVVITPCRTISYDVNVVLLQHLPDLLNIIHIHTGNTNAAVDIAVTVLNNFKLKRNAVQTKNDFPAQ